MNIVEFSSPSLVRQVIVPYQRCYATQISQLYHQAIHAMSGQGYSEAQLSAWSMKPRSSMFWHLRLSRSKTWLLIDYQGIQSREVPKCLGFINVETNFWSKGYIDCLYIHPAYQHRGFGQLLLEQLLSFASLQGYKKLEVDASYFSKGLFEKNGFKVRYKSYQTKHGEVVEGYLMRLNLESQG